MFSMIIANAIYLHLLTTPGKYNNHAAWIFLFPEYPLRYRQKWDIVDNNKRPERPSSTALGASPGKKPRQEDVFDLLAKEKVPDHTGEDEEDTTKKDGADGEGVRENNAEGSQRGDAGKSEAAATASSE